DESGWARSFIATEKPRGDCPGREINPWNFGWGSFDESKGEVEFHGLPHFSGGAWQGGDELPDSELGWVTLNAEGGHPGDESHAAIRRFRAPAAGVVQVDGELAHGASQGDGVRARIVSGGETRGPWLAHDSRCATPIASLPVMRGDAVDFIIDCRNGESYDSFRWTATVSLTVEDGAKTTWSTRDGFHGPSPPPLSPWGRLAQILLMSNEFAFVD
ncbi:MAG: hypothetical protein AAF961_16075, partial [Planctomycetota bacterium]